MKVAVFTILLFGCNYKTDPTTQGDYLACVEYSGCNKAWLACALNDAISRGRTLQQQQKLEFHTYCFIQPQLCKKRCLQCAANSGSRGSTTNCKFSEFKFMYTDYSDGMY